MKIAAFTCDHKLIDSEDVSNLAKSLNIPDSNSCLKSQLFGEDEMIGIPADFCACSDELSDYSSTMGEQDKRSVELERKIKDKIEQITMKGLRSRLFENHDFMLAFDTSIRAGDFSKNDLDQIGECSINRIWHVRDAIVSKRKEKPSYCPSMEKRLAMIASGDEQESDLDSLKKQLEAFTSSLNKNQSLSEGDIPLRAYYASKNNVPFTSSELNAIKRLSSEGLSPSSRLPLEAIQKYESFKNDLGVGFDPFSWDEVTDSQKLYNISVEYKRNQKDLESLRGNQLLRLLMTEGGGEPVVEKIKQLSSKKNESSRKIREDFEEKAKEQGIQYPGMIQTWPEALMTQHQAAQNKAESDINKEIEELVNSRDAKRTALRLLNNRCSKFLVEDKIIDIICEEELEPPAEVLRNEILPSVIADLNGGEENLPLSQSVSRLYCNPFREDSEFYQSLDLSNTFPSSLELLHSGKDERYNLMSEEISPILAEYIGPDKDWNEQAKNELVQKLTESLLESSLAGREFVLPHEREETREAIHQMLTGEEQTSRLHGGDPVLISSVAAMIDKPFQVTGDTTHEQETLGGIFAESTEEETGFAANYSTRATDTDVEASRARLAEREAAAREGREVDQDIINENAYLVRDESGTVIENPTLFSSSTPRVLTPGDPIAVPDDGLGQQIRRPVEPIERALNESVPAPSGTPSPSTGLAESRSSSSSSSHSSSETSRRSPSKAPREPRERTVRQDNSDLENMIAERRREIERLQRDLDKSPSDAARERIRQANERIKDLENRMARDTSPKPTRRPSRRPASAPGLPATGIGSGFGNFVNPFTNHRMNEENYVSESDYDPYSPAGQSNLTPEDSGDEKSRNSSSRRTGKGKTAASSKGGASAKKGGSAGIFGSRAESNFNKDGTPICNTYVLNFKFNCYSDMELFDQINHVSVEFDNEETVWIKRNTPVEYIRKLGLEGKTFTILEKMKKDEFVLYTYDYIPATIEEYEAMNKDPNWRINKLQEINLLRWDPLYMEEVASRTKKNTRDETFTRNEFLEAAKERKLSPFGMSEIVNLKRDVKNKTNKAILARRKETNQDVLEQAQNNVNKRDVASE